MSGSEFHVHDPHDHEVEHAAGNHVSSCMAVARAILAKVGGLFSYMGAYAQANAALFKNNAAIKKTEASNQCGLSAPVNLACACRARLSV